MKQNKQFFRRLLAVAFWLAVWQAAAMAIGQEVFLVSPVQALRTLVQLLPRADFWQRVGFSSGRILLGFVLGAVFSVVLAVCAARWSAADALLAPVMQLVKATPVASFIILALVWVRGSALSVLISFLMVLPVLYGAVRTGIAGADVQLLEMAAVFRLPAGRRLRAVWLPAVLPAFRQGCSVALGICWKSGVAAEVIGLPNGSIGDALYRAKITLSTGELFAWTFVIILLSAGFPAGKSGGWRCCGRCGHPATPCYWTSPLPAWTRTPCSGRRRCCGSAARASRCCWLPTMKAPSAPLAGR